MKKTLKIICIVLLAIIAVCSFAACGNNPKDPKTGLFVKKIDGVWTAYKYVDDGKTTKLDIGSYNNSDVTIERIMPNIFSGNETLTEIIVPATVNTIDEGAFSSIVNLEKLTVPFIGKTANADAYQNQTQKTEDKSCDSARTFAHFFGTSDYHFSTALTTAFNNGEGNSKTYYIPLSLKTISVNPKENYEIPMFAFNGVLNVQTVELGDKVIGIGEYAFSGCSDIQTLTLKNVQIIYSNAFKGCTKLLDWNESSNTGLKLVENTVLTEIRDSAFIGTSLKNVVLPDTVEIIGNNAFSSTEFDLTSETCVISKLETVTLSSSLVNIGNEAFANCPYLTKVVVKATVEQTEIGVQAFSKCVKLKSFGVEGTADMIIDLASVSKLGANSFEELVGDFTVQNKGSLDIEKAFRNTSVI